MRAEETPTVSSLPSKLDMLEQLKRHINYRNYLTGEIARLRALLGMQVEDRPVWNCKRCGHTWHGQSVYVLPRHCPRCHSSGWDTAGTGTGRGRRPTRKPGDPPAPWWSKSRHRKPESESPPRTRRRIPAADLALVRGADETSDPISSGLPAPPPPPPKETPFVPPDMEFTTLPEIEAINDEVPVRILKDGSIVEIKSEEAPMEDDRPVGERELPIFSEEDYNAGRVPNLPAHQRSPEDAAALFPKREPDPNEIPADQEMERYIDDATGLPAWRPKQK